ncbi:hypothetical protein Z3_110 [Bacillus phage Z3]|nr:hypothetical protein Z3_110 [Bacillus phage Z3]
MKITYPKDKCMSCKRMTIGRLEHKYSKIKFTFCKRCVNAGRYNHDLFDGKYIE